MSSPRRFSFFSRRYRLLGRLGRLPTPASAAAGWTRSRDAPLPPPETFREWWRRTRGPR